MEQALPGIMVMEFPAMDFQTNFDNLDNTALETY